MSLDVWLLFLLVALVPAVTPGPAILFNVSNAIRHGKKVTIIIGGVNAFGLLLVGLAVGFGLGAVMTLSTYAFIAMKIIGALYLVYLGVKIWRDRSALDPNSQASGAKLPKLMAHALAIALTNPKAFVALMALFSQFMDASKAAAPQVIILAVTYAIMCWINHIGIAFAGAWLRRFLTNPRRVVWVRRLTGGLFVAFGAALAGSSS
ncbi:LysE family translocator [Rhodovibrionaceae bacterium A322]